MMMMMMMMMILWSLSRTTPNHNRKPNPRPNPTQPIIDTWYDILGYTENFIQHLLRVTDKFTVRS